MRSNYPIDLAPVITDLLTSHAPVALGISGGKDSGAMGLATTEYLDEIGHRGPRLFIHSDLGRVEWKTSGAMCQRLADHLAMELVVVQRQAGDLMDRWLVRWRNNCERYTSLQCVKLILPWSTPAMPFCRSELKTAIICRYLVERFPGQVSISGSGIRRQESPKRAKAPVAAPQSRLVSATFGTSGYDWHPILNWNLEQVLAYHQFRQFPLHDAYIQYGMTRVSCAFCMLASLADLTASTTCADNQNIYREMVAVEAISTFSFQEGQWLGDIAPLLLSEELRADLEEAKRRAALREAAEARIPKHLLYSAGWPTTMPTYDEASLLGEVRATVAEVVGLTISYVEPDAILDRFAELIEEKRRKDELKKKQKREPVVYTKGA